MLSARVGDSTPNPKKGAKGSKAVGNETPILLEKPGPSPPRQGGKILASTREQGEERGDDVRGARPSTKYRDKIVEGKRGEKPVRDFDHFPREG